VSDEPKHEKRAVVRDPLISFPPPIVPSPAIMVPTPCRPLPDVRKFFSVGPLVKINTVGLGCAVANVEPEADAPVTPAEREALARLALTGPQRRELKDIFSDGSRHYCGTSTVRLHNTLVAKGLARLAERPAGSTTLTHCELNELGVKVAGIIRRLDNARSRARGRRRLQRTGARP